MNSIQPAVRFKGFDALKLFAIFLVLWGHCIQCLISGEFVDKPVYIFIYSFHMPLFMMVAGYFAASSMQLPPLIFMKKKFIQLILPFLSWGICLATITFFVMLLCGDILPLADIGHLIKGNFWFLKCLFICYVVAYVGMRLFKKRYLMVIVTMIFVQFFYNFQLPIMYPCFLVGMYLKSKDMQWQKNAVRLFIISLLSFIGLLLFWDKTFWDYKIYDFISVFIKQRDYPLMYLYKEIYRIVIGVVGSLSFMFLFYLLFKQKRSSKLFDICCDWGKYTLGVYILQSYILENLMAKYVNLDYFGFASFNFIVAPLVAVCVMTLCVMLAKLASKNRILSFWFLGKSR